MNNLEEVFMYHHENPPASFNKNTAGKGLMREAADEMEDDGYYDNHTRDECATEIRIRYDKRLLTLMNKGA